MWIEKLGSYFVDVSKYILTGVVISSLFKDFEDKVLIYIVGIALAFLCLVVGLIPVSYSATKRMERAKRKRRNKLWEYI